MTKKEFISFTRGVPAPESFPANQLAQCAAEALQSESATILQYGNAGGYLPLREWIAGKNRISTERVLLGQGSLQLMDHLVRLLVKPGDVVFVEQPTYDRALTILRRACAKIHAFDLGNEGISPAEVEKELKRGIKPKLFYLIPDFQNPTGNVMSHARRQRLLELADQYNLLVIEDSSYRSLRYSGEDIPSLFELAPQRVIQMSSFSKLISPGLRVGYLISTPDLTRSITRFAEDTYINASYFNHAIVFHFIQHGWLDSNLIKLKQLYSERLSAMLTALENELSPNGIWSHPQGGFFIGLWLKEKQDLDSLFKLSAQENIQLSDGRGFFVQDGQDFIRLPFCALTALEIKEGIKRLGRVICH
jgi:2-aminoadipate transaminase